MARICMLFVGDETNAKLVFYFNCQLAKKPIFLKYHNSLNLVFSNYYIFWYLAIITFIGTNKFIKIKMINLC